MAKKIITVIMGLLLCIPGFSRPSQELATSAGQTSWIPTLLTLGVAGYGYYRYSQWRKNSMTPAVKEAEQYLRALDENILTQTSGNGAELLRFVTPWKSPAAIKNDKANVARSLAASAYKFDLCMCYGAAQDAKLVHAINIEQKNIARHMKALEKFSSLPKTWGNLAEGFKLNATEHLTDLGEPEEQQVKEVITPECPVSWKTLLSSPRLWAKRLVFPYQTQVNGLYWKLFNLKEKLEATKGVIHQDNSFKSNHASPAPKPAKECDSSYCVFSKSKQ